jgi:stage II sporulation protein D
MGSPLKKVINYKLGIISFAAFLFLTHPLLPISGNYCYAQENYIRIAVILDCRSANVSVEGSYQILDSENKRLILKGKDLKTTVLSYEQGLLIANRNIKANRILIEPAPARCVGINNRPFRGMIEVIKKKNTHLLIVNHIDCEEYIRGVLYHEVSHHWPMAALCAQAVIARTFALYQSRKNQNKYYDLTSNIYSQVYGGRISERYRTNKAVELTRGQVITFNSRLFPAYYHATCGGHTQDAAFLWGVDIKPLRGIRCDFCRNSPHFNWHYTLRLETIEDLLRKKGFEIGRIKDISVQGRNKSNRVIWLWIRQEGEKKLRLRAKDFRHIIGPNVIRSTNFTVQIYDSDVYFEGYGWGHGVGLCQWGAYFMAKQGYKYKQILKYYYPGCEISSLY